MPEYIAMMEESYRIFIDCRYCGRQVWTVVEASSFDEFSNDFDKTEDKSCIRIENYMSHASQVQKDIFNNQICPICAKKKKKFEELVRESQSTAILLTGNEADIVQFFKDLLKGKPKWPGTT